MNRTDFAHCPGWTTLHERLQALEPDTSMHKDRIVR